MQKAPCVKSRLFFSAIFLAGVFFLAGTALAEDFTVFTGQINAERVNVRADATVGSPVACVLDKGDLVEVLSEAHGWYKIRMPKKADSYIKKELVECIDKTPGECSSGKVTGNRVNVRVSPNLSSWIAGKVDKATAVNIRGEENGWYKIEPVYQSYAWINNRFVDKEIVVLEKAANGCPVSPAQGAGDALSKPSLPVFEGVVMPYGVVLWRKATHKLITDDKKIYLLKGNKKNLNDLNYRRVKVSGRPTGEGGRYPVIEVDIVEVLN
ncbi:MAG: SH3 domain-containing protein [Candidatus Omnitrophica bacterium]|nr:SH3 domain-containing protein [Candidatus Omnitrophota bacterium]MDD5042609.1 SH3 domain-containing protein [Candidatus Omnitrophota bacterium]MDD5500371.1 SH3 domain-containing protein [Candidatus Omnitrophota bacterium]